MLQFKEDSNPFIESTNVKYFSFGTWSPDDSMYTLKSTLRKI